MRRVAYYSDLSPYEYTRADSPMLNVGWLAAGHDFTTGGVPAEIFTQLLQFADSQVNIMRGVHDCEFCSVESPIRMAAPTERGSVALGMGEIHVVDKSGCVYAAPSLILHYIQDHNYRPPDVFIRAVEEMFES